jgi:hypothetical protein
MRRELLYIVIFTLCFMFYFHFSIILDILVCNDNGSDRITYSSLLAFFIQDT